MRTEKVEKAKPSRRNENEKGRNQTPPSADLPHIKDGHRNKNFDTFGHCARIPWTEKETEHVKELIEYLTVQLKEHEGTNNLPREETHHLLTTLQLFLRQEELDRNDPLLSKVAYYFNDVKCVDLDKVGQFLKANKKVGDVLDQKDVILLLGQASSGKTTTLHCLAGTTFREVVVDGFVHLQPTQFLDASVAQYETSCGRTSITKRLQTAHVNMMDEEYVVCDTPVFGDFDSLEEEIAYKHGFMEAISRARKIRPVFVLSQECLGNRMSELPEVYKMMISHFEPSALQDFDTLPFQYVFTRFDDRHRTRLCKMFKFYQESAGVYEGENPELFDKVIEDMIQKTTPEANLVCPISDIPRYLLRSLVENQGLFCEPEHTLKHSGPSPAWNLLHIQLKLTLYSLMMFLAIHDFQAAVERVQHLADIADALPTARTYLDLGLKACERYAVMLWETYHDRMDHNDYISALMNISLSIEISVVLPQLDEYVKLNYDMFWKRFVILESMSDQALPVEVVKLLRDIAQHQPEIHAEILGGIRGMRASVMKEIQKTNRLASSTPHIRLLVALSAGFPEANKASNELLEKLDARILDRAKEKDFRASTDDLVAIGRLFREYPSKTRFCVHAIKLYKHAMDQAIDKQFYDQACDTMVYMTKLRKDYPATEKIVARGLEKLWKKFEFAIKQREYAAAVCIIKHMSKLAEYSDSAFEKSRLGIEVIRDRLFKSIETKNYGMAQVLMQQLTRLEKALPRTSPGKELKTSDDHRDDNHGSERQRESKEREGKAPKGLARKMSPPRGRHDSGDKTYDSLYTIVSESVDDYKTGPSMSDDQRVQHFKSGNRESSRPRDRHRTKNTFRTSDEDNHRDKSRTRGNGHRKEMRDDDYESSGRHEHDDEELSDDLMSELTMSEAGTRRRKGKHAKDARREPPPPLSKIGPTMTKIAKSKRGESIPRKGRYESPNRKNRVERQVSRNGRRDIAVMTHIHRYESPPAREGRSRSRRRSSARERSASSSSSVNEKRRAKSRPKSRSKSRYDESPNLKHREPASKQRGRLSKSPLASRKNRVSSSDYKHDRKAAVYDDYGTYDYEESSLPFDEYSSPTKTKISAPGSDYDLKKEKPRDSHTEESEQSWIGSGIRFENSHVVHERLDCDNSIASLADTGSWDI